MPEEETAPAALRDQFEAAVDHGCERLDAHCGLDWPLRVDPVRLNMRQDLDCVLGQLFPHFAAGARALFGSDWDSEAEAAGFYLPPDRAEGYGLLQEVWDGRLGRLQREQAPQAA